MNLGFLVRAWLRQQAQARLRESFEHAAQQPAGPTKPRDPARPEDATTQGSAHGENSARDGDQQRPREDRAAHDAVTLQPQPRPCDVGLVFALSTEMGGLEDLLEGVVTTHARGCLVRQGGYKGRSVVLVRSGAGRDAAARATQALIAGHRPRCVISAGFAGGLQAGLRRGDIILADRVVDVSGKPLVIDVKVEQPSIEEASALRVGTILTVDKIVSRSADKRALGETHAALAADMESWAVGEVCRQDKVPFMAVRIISDAVDEELPAELDHMLKQKAPRGWRAPWPALWRRPSSAKDMLRLNREALVNSDRLARFLLGVIERLTPRG